MPKELEKIRKDILKGNAGMSTSMSYALATNIYKKRHKAGVHKSKKNISKSTAYRKFEKSEPKDIESHESFAEKASELKRGMR